MVKTRMTTLAPSAASPLKTGLQTLTLTGLRFDANLGILAHEKIAPQPIQVDAELNLGQQPLAVLLRHLFGGGGKAQNQSRPQKQHPHHRHGRKGDGQDHLNAGAVI